MKVLVEPIPGALDDVPKEHLQAWYEDLQTSQKHTGSMCNADNTKHCCLCRSAIVEGATYSDYQSRGLPKSYFAPITTGMATIPVAKVKSANLHFQCLNDGVVLKGNSYEFALKLTHKQIAEIVIGNSVEVEV